MTAADVVARLAAHRTIGAAPPGELEWLAARGSLRHLNVGDVLTPKGQKTEGLFILLSGRIAISVDRGGGGHRLEWREGDVLGLLPYSRLVSPPADTFAEEPADVFAVPRDQLPEMIRECGALTSILVHTMIDRARAFTSADLHDEKMLSLGKLSAGLAHELNNPASAIERSATLLDRHLEDYESSARALGAARLDDRQLAALDAVRVSCVATRQRGVRSPLEQGEREEALADWLDGHGLDPAIADALAETSLTVAALDTLVSAVQGPALDNVLRWVAAACSVRRLASEIQEAATRISVLVGAVKGFTHMDQAAVPEPVDVARGIDDTVTVLRSKARSKAASVVVEIAPGLPKVRGLVGELNQIWSNLIDNALDAIPESGRVDVRATAERDRVTVRIIDNGGGIPSHVRDRIFDPFFTTKPVGQGTGLGLDIVRRLVLHNGGEIGVESQPGRTEFRVALPAVRPEPSGINS
jgi:signal transduction histidine kinase